MELVVCVGVNVPCAALGLVINLFYVSCLGPKTSVKQPLWTLLVLMIFCTSLFQVSLILHFSLGISGASWNFKHAVQAFMFYAVRVSIPTTLWLNICYYIQIVPGRTSFFAWLKRNVRVVVYVLVAFTKMYFLVYYVLEYVSVYGLTSDTRQVNATAGDVAGITGASRKRLDQFLDVLDAVTMALVFLALSAMLGVTSTTVRFLYKHIKKMTDVGTSIRSRLLRNQVRVTIAGFVQGLLYLICSAGMFLDLYCTYHRYRCNRNVLWTFFCVYSLATTINLGVGQARFRRRFARLLKKGINCTKRLP